MLGNQRINIAGKYFDDTDAPIDVKIAGLLRERMGGVGGGGGGGLVV